MGVIRPVLYYYFDTGISLLEYVYLAISAQGASMAMCYFYYI